MISRFQPVKLNAELKDKVLHLGKEASISVELIADRNVEIRDGRIDLVCEEKYTDMYSVSRHSGTPQSGYTQQVTKEQTDNYVHSTVSFLKDAQLRRGSSNQYQVVLRVQPDPPRNQGSTVTWALVTTVDVARARDLTTKQDVQVELS